MIALLLKSEANCELMLIYVSLAFVFSDRIALKRFKSAFVSTTATIGPLVPTLTNPVSWYDDVNPDWLLTKTIWLASNDVALIVSLNDSVSTSVDRLRSKCDKTGEVVSLTNECTARPLVDNMALTALPAISFTVDELTDKYVEEDETAKGYFCLIMLVS